jgi:cytochrome c oxidase subunit 1
VGHAAREVLYAFYAPLKASPWFYVGAALLIIGTWLVLADICVQVAYFKRTHPDQRIPPPAYLSLANFVMWFLASLGVAWEVLFQLIPWAFGWVPGVDVQLSRLLFWYFGHPLVYFWLFGAYLIWYLVVPKILNVPVFSDTLTRVAFILLVLLSLPVGVHHEFADPGIASGWKGLQTFFTLLVVISSLMTWHPWLMVAAIGGSILFASVLCYLVAFVKMVFGGEPGTTEFGFAEAAVHAERFTPAILDRWGLWTAVAIVLVIIAYVGPMTQHFHYHIYGAAGMRTW